MLYIIPFLKKSSALEEPSRKETCLTLHNSAFPEALWLRAPQFCQCSVNLSKEEFWENTRVDDLWGSFLVVKFYSSGNESNPLFLCYFNRMLLFISLFYFLVNVSNFTGCKQNGTKLGDVILPPWAKGDPREFIRVHREVMGAPFAVELRFHWVTDHRTKRGPWAMCSPCV